MIEESLPKAQQIEPQTLAPNTSEAFAEAPEADVLEHTRLMQGIAEQKQDTKRGLIGIGIGTAALGGLGLFKRLNEQGMTEAVHANLEYLAGTSLGVVAFSTIATVVSYARVMVKEAKAHRIEQRFAE